MRAEQRKTRVAILSVLSNTGLLLGKLCVGVAIGSVSVISEAIHSGVDLLAAVIALYAVRTSGKPADAGHPYGHGKIENISGTVEALLIFAAAVGIIYEAVHRLLHHQALQTPLWGVAMMLISALANIIVSSQLAKVGKATESVALQADAWHLRTDVWTSFGVMAGLAVIALGRRYFPAVDLAWLDPLTAIAVALLIVQAAWTLTLESARDLLDVSLPADEEVWLQDYISLPRPHVQSMHNLRTRKNGAQRYIECHLLMHPSLSVAESHAVTDDIADGIRHRFPGAVVTIHVEPGEGTSNNV